MMTSQHSLAFCPHYHRAIELIGRRWTGAILRVIYDGTNRFSDIAAAVPGLSDRLLSERLKELEMEGIVTRTVYPDIPVRIEYCLTEKGRDLGQIMDGIGDWAHKWLAGQHELPEKFDDDLRSPSDRDLTLSER
ncbi:MAG: winged helix-turn-helix transcriptional regulator [Thermomicrobiales bacterium]